MTVQTENIAKLAVEQIEELFTIIGDLTYPGYKISLCKIKGLSHQQCANRFGLTKDQVYYFWDKCRKKSYDEALKRIFNLP